jgi:hypothetical protein
MMITKTPYGPRKNTAMSDVHGQAHAPVFACVLVAGYTSGASGEEGCADA